MPDTPSKPPSKRYDITNPLAHRRVIFDGIANAGPIGIDPGETKQNVELADHVAEKLLAQKDDLQLKPVGGGSVTVQPPTADMAAQTAPKAQSPLQPPPPPPQQPQPAPTAQTPPRPQQGRRPTNPGRR